MEEERLIIKSSKLLGAGCYGFVRNALNVACCTIRSDLRTDKFPADLFHFCVIKGT